mmetsp:Transcript_50820/g.91329  ORF Transcript_50820/g.91329 Transcript_50820/m.91329 type:complete len:353 (+) Transcript_50820:100-1158(+)
MDWASQLWPLSCCNSKAAEGMAVEIASDAENDSSAEEPEFRHVKGASTIDLSLLKYESLEWQQKVEALTKRGISLLGLLDFYTTLFVSIPNFHPDRTTTSQVVRLAVIPTTKPDEGSTQERDASYATQAASHSGGHGKVPGVLVTHHWSNVFSHTVAAIVADALGFKTYCSVLEHMYTEQNVESCRKLILEKGVGDNTYWLCALSVDQHCTICDSHFGKDSELFPMCSCGREKHWDGPACEVNKFHHVMERLRSISPAFRHIVAVDKDFNVFTCAWCLAEIAQGADMGISQKLQMFSLAALFRHRSQLRKLDVRDCQTSVPSDKERRLHMIPHKNAFNTCIREKLLHNENGM